MATVVPANKACFTVDEVLAVTAGELVRGGKQPSAVGVCTDTRRLSVGNIYVALRGAKLDGHAFVADAQAARAAIFVVSRDVDVPGDGAVVRVADTLVALGQLACAHRRRWVRSVRQAGADATVVAVTGSAGKTTTCRAVAAMLQALAPDGVHEGIGNLNNAIGLPMVLLGLEPRHRFAVVEVATSAPGEVAYGASLAEPDISVLTLVTCAHGEGLGSIDHVAREKGTLFEATAVDGVAIANGDDSRASAQLLRTRTRATLTYGMLDSAPVKLVSRCVQSVESQRLSFAIRTGQGTAALDMTTRLLGDAGAYAVAAAVAVVLARTGGQVDWQGCVRAIEPVRGEDGRLRAQWTASGALVIDDSYNANPASMEASIRAAAEMAHHLNRPLVLVLGEMRELGADSAAEHDRIGKVARESGATRLIAVGGASARMVGERRAGGPTCSFVPNAAMAVGEVTQAVTGNEVILIKGSRSIALEQVVDALGVVGSKDTR